MNHESDFGQVRQYQCPHCGVVLETDEPIEGTRVTCPECGKEFVAASLEGNPTLRPVAPSVSTASPKEPTSPGIKRKIRIPLVLVMLVSILGCGWLVFSSLKNGNDTEDGGSSGGVLGFAPSKQKKGRGKNRVSPILTLQNVDVYCKEHGGAVPPDAYSFAEPVDGVAYSLEGNPVYFMSPWHLLWNYHESSPGGGYVFIRKNVEDLPEEKFVAFRENAVMKVGREVLSSVHYMNLNRNVADTTQALWTNAFNRSIQYPAPVVFAFSNNACQFLYLNEAGHPSVLEWGVRTNGWCWCHEGSEALGDYSRCLKELRKRMDEYISIAKDEGLREYTKTIPVKEVPTIYIGDLDRGRREKATVRYEFLVEPDREGVRYKIRETTDCPLGVFFQFWTLDRLDREITFFSRFETKKSIEKAFEPLHCFLSQRKILLEEGELESARLARRFEGGVRAKGEKNEQTLTFNPIGKQYDDACVELAATAESGGSVQFAVESGPGKIDGNTLSFTGPGKVVVCARQWGNDKWYSATATQTVEVVRVPSTWKIVTTSTGESPSEVAEQENHSTGGADSSSAPGRSGSPEETSSSSSAPGRSGRAEEMSSIEEDNQPSAHPAAPSELTRMSEALKAFKQEKTPGNLKAMESAWRALPEKQKSRLQKNVMWASCAMYLAKGHPENLVARKAFLNVRALMGEVSEECRSCYGSGHVEQKCKMCGGTGDCRFAGCIGGKIQRLGSAPSPCPNCRGSGRCYVCGGRGTEEVKCSACNGSGRRVSQDKCLELVDENIEEALRTCRDME